MVATRKSAAAVPAAEPDSATESAGDADSLEETDTILGGKAGLRSRGFTIGPEGLSPLRVGSLGGSPSSASSADDVRVWPLCFAIAIEKSRRVRPAIMVGASSLLAAVTYHLQESDASLLVRESLLLRSYLY